jgi:hypothetical protein
MRRRHGAAGLSCYKGCGMTASIPPVAEHGEPPDPLAHRRLTGQPLGCQSFAGSDLFARVGGRPTVDRLVDLLYDGFEADPALRPLFPRDLTAAGPVTRCAGIVTWAVRRPSRGGALLLCSI